MDALDKLNLIKLSEAPQINTSEIWKSLFEEFKRNLALKISPNINVNNFQELKNLIYNQFKGSSKLEPILQKINKADVVLSGLFFSSSISEQLIENTKKQLIDIANTINSIINTQEQKLETPIEQKTQEDSLMKIFYHHLNNALSTKPKRTELKEIVISLLPKSLEELLKHDQTLKNLDIQSITHIFSIFGETRVQKFIKSINNIDILKKYIPNDQANAFIQKIQQKYINLSEDTVFNEIKEYLALEISKEIAQEIVAMLKQNIAGEFGGDITNLTSKDYLKVFITQKIEDAKKNLELVSKINDETPHIISNNNVIFTKKGKILFLTLWNNNLKAPGKFITEAYAHVTKDEAIIQAEDINLLASGIDAIRAYGNYQVQLSETKAEKLGEWFPKTALLALTGGSQLPAVFKILAQKETGEYGPKSRDLANAINMFVKLGLFPPYGPISATDRWTYIYGAAPESPLASISNFLHTKITGDLFATILIAIANSNNPILKFVKEVIRFFRPMAVQIAESPLNLQRQAIARINYLNIVKDLFEKYPTTSKKSIYIKNIKTAAEEMENDAQDRIHLRTMDNIIHLILEKYKGKIETERVICLVKQVSSEDSDYILLDIVFPNQKFKDESIFGDNTDWRYLLSQKDPSTLGENIGDDARPVYVVTKTTQPENIFIYPRFQLLIPVKTFREKKETTEESSGQKIKINPKVRPSGTIEKSQMYISPANISATQALRVQKISEFNQIIDNILNKTYLVKIKDKLLPAKELEIGNSLIRMDQEEFAKFKKHLRRDDPDNPILNWTFEDLKQFRKTLFKSEKEFTKVKTGVGYLLKILSMIKIALKRKAFELMNWSTNIEKFLTYLKDFLESKSVNNKIILDLEIDNLEKDIITLVEHCFGETGIYRYLPIPNTSLEKEYLPEKNEAPASEIFSIKEQPKKSLTSFISKLFKLGAAELYVQTFVYEYVPAERRPADVDTYKLSKEIKNIRGYLQYHIGDLSTGKETILIELNNIYRNTFLPLLRHAKSYCANKKKYDALEIIKDIETNDNITLKNLLKQPELNYDAILNVINTIIEKEKYLGLDPTYALKLDNKMHAPPGMETKTKISEIYTQDRPDKKLIRGAFFDMQLSSIENLLDESSPQQTKAAKKLFESIVKTIEADIGRIPRISIIDMTKVENSTIYTQNFSYLYARPEKVHEVFEHLHNARVVPEFSKTIIPIFPIRPGKESPKELATKYATVYDKVAKDIPIREDVLMYLVDTLSNGVGIIVRYTVPEELDIKIKHKPKIQQKPNPVQKQETQEKEEPQDTNPLLLEEEEETRKISPWEEFIKRIDELLSKPSFPTDKFKTREEWYSYLREQKRKAQEILEKNPDTPLPFNFIDIYYLTSKDNETLLSSVKNELISMGINPNIEETDNVTYKAEWLRLLAIVYRLYNFYKDNPDLRAELSVILNKLLLNFSKGSWDQPIDINKVLNFIEEKIKNAGGKA